MSLASPNGSCVSAPPSNGTWYSVEPGGYAVERVERKLMYLPSGEQPAVRAKRIGSWAGAAQSASAAAASVQSERQSMGPPEVKRSINVVVKGGWANRRRLNPSLLNHTPSRERSSKGNAVKVT